MKNTTLPDLDRPVRDFVRPVATTLEAHLTAGAAIDVLRSRKIEERILYFYVIDGEGRLQGVLPTRRLLLAPTDAKLTDLMHTPVHSVAADRPMREAMEMFTRRRHLALPVVDADGRMLGAVDIRLYADEAVDMAGRIHQADVYQLIGVSLEQYEQGSPLGAYRLRMPWLVANMLGGLACAAIATWLGEVLEEVLVIAAFIPLVLTLSESVAIQSLTLGLQHMHASTIAWADLRPVLVREWAATPLLGITCAVIVGLAALLWAGSWSAPLAIGGVILVVMVLAATIGVCVPLLLHVVRLDPKVAAGPLVLMLVDTATMLIYLSAATAVLL
jgi:magnesium transporter